MPTKPTDLGRWGALSGDDTANPDAQIATPPSAKQDVGWEFDTGAGTGEKPPVQWENWKGFVKYLWNKYLNDLVDTLKLEGFEVSAQSTPDDTVSVKAGKFRNGLTLVEVAADPTFGPFAAPYASYDRIDLVYATDGGALAIETGDLLDAAASASAATREFKLAAASGDQTAKYTEGQTFLVLDASANNGSATVKDSRFDGSNTFIRTVETLVNSTGGQIHPRFGGKMVIAAVTIRSGGSTVITSGDIQDVRAWQSAPAFSGDDAAFGGVKTFDRLQKFAAGVSMLLGGAPWRVRQRANSDSGQIQWVAGINCDPDALDTATPQLTGVTADPETGYPRGVFSTADGVMAFRLVVNTTNRVLEVYTAPAGWTDDGSDIALTRMLRFIMNESEPTWQIYDGTALRDIATNGGCSGDVQGDGTHDAGDFLKNENLIYRGTSAFLTGQTEFQVRKHATGLYHVHPPSDMDTSDFREISFIPDNVGVIGFTPSADGEGNYWAFSFYTYADLPSLTAADTGFLLSVRK